MSDVLDDESVPRLPGVVVERLRTELGTRAEKVFGCLRTAAALVAQAEADVSGLRLAESAAYNLREALNHVVEGQDAAEGGLRAVVDAWRRFKAQTGVPGVDAAAARDELDQVLSRVAADESRASYYARRLVAYLQYRAGVSPLDLPGDPVSEYGELRDKASTAVHNELTLAEVETLLARTVAWFIRVFTPPDQVAEAIRALAAQPWSGQEQIDELKRLATDDHHLRLFFSEITDPAWLEPLHQAGVVHLPSHAPWPVVGLLAGLGKTSPEAVADLLRRLLADTAAMARNKRVAARFELLRIATQIGPPAHGVVVEVVRQHSDVPSVRSLSVDVALRADTADSSVLVVADAVLNHFRRFRDGDRYHAVTILDQLQAGITAGNVADRARMLAGKTRRLARSDAARYMLLGIEALTIDPGEHPEPLVLFAHHLARILSKARQWGVPTSEQLEWLGEMQGEVGERLRGHALAGANDVPVTDKMAHIAGRLASSTATAEDLALVTDILSRSPAPGDLAAWAEALGTPSPAPADGEDEIPRDWARAWRWAAVLPADVLTAWRDAIDYVSGFYGTPDPRALTGDRPPRWVFRYGRSPYSAEDLSARPPLETAALVAAWEPGTESERQMFGHLELAGALEEAVRSNPAEWSAAPQDVVTALGQPLYIEHYFRALTEQAADIVPQASAVLAAALAQPPAGGGQAIHQDTEEASDREDWQKVVLDLATALANKDGDLTSTLNDLWERALTAARSVPETDIGLLFADNDPVTRAINRMWGHGLQTVLALAAWEFRSRGTVRPEFEQTLDAVIGTTGAVGLEFRAILASRRPLLEAIAATWLVTHAAALFREGALAQETFDLTVKWSQPTTWLYREFTDELFGAALRGADNAIRLILVAAFHEVEGYDLDTVINRLGKDPAVLATAAEDAAFLMQDAEPDSPHLTIGIRFWVLLLDTDRAKIPAQALAGLGRWAFVGNIDDGQWAYLTVRTLDTTDGQIDYPISVADRAARLPPSSTSRGILLRLLDNGEPWERYHTATKALDVLRASFTQPTDDSFRRNAMDLMLFA